MQPKLQYPNKLKRPQTFLGRRTTAKSPSLALQAQFRIAERCRIVPRSIVYLHCSCLCEFPPCWSASLPPTSDLEWWQWWCIFNGQCAGPHSRIFPALKPWHLNQRMSNFVRSPCSNRWFWGGPFSQRCIPRQRCWSAIGSFCLGPTGPSSLAEGRAVAWRFGLEVSPVQS